ncbi:hypothetical protein B0A55_03731 [Friedmanniomyces simplex]|uniref:Uncharacterized protein n=1 Tax=Friedmanniomyces simplex TaxID=329884 RepID=A0A4U0XLF4_9PEZI|nr:hypothetical protein B0A55_03731 [Friedmanniomyces simplex]
MSYADMAKKGPKQADEDTAQKVPHALPEIAHDDSSVHSLDSTDTGMHASASSSYADQQKAAEDNAREARDTAKQTGREAKSAAKDTANQASKDAKDFTNRAESSAKDLEQKGSEKAREYADEAKEEWDEVSTDAKKKYNKLASDAQDELEKAKVQGKKGYKEAKQEGKEAEEWADKNKGNPVVIGNLLVVAALGGLLGTNAYRMHKAGTLTWNVIGAWAGVVGLFAVGDYYVSQWFFRNKYPTK